MQLDLFGTPSKVHGKKDFPHYDFQNTRRSLSRASRHIEGAFKLGVWVSKQRAKRDNMFAERRQQLDEIDFVWRVK